MRTDSTTLSDEALAGGPVARPGRCTATTTCPTSPAATTRRSRTPRRPTRPSARPATPSAPPSRPGCTATSAGCTSWCGCGRWRRRWPTRVGQSVAGPPGRAVVARRARTPSSRPAAGHHLPRLPAGLRGGLRRSRRRARGPGGPPARPGGRRPAGGVESLEAEGHATQPPARYTEASLVKALEELGVGRPSTYASILDTIQDRGYVWKKGTALVPVVDRLRRDRAARAVLRRAGRLRVHRLAWRTTSTRSPGAARRRVPWLTRFYFGNGAARAEAAGLRAPRRDRRPGDQLHPDRRTGLRTRRAGRSVRAVRAAGRRERASGPRGPGARRADRGPGRSSCSRPGRPSGCSAPIPRSGLPVVVRAGRFGPYVQVGAADEAAAGKPAHRVAAAAAWIRPR